MTAHTSRADNATHTPWYATIYPNQEGYHIQSTNKEVDNYVGIIETEANARLIVKAVNMHDDLISCLKETVLKLRKEDCYYKNASLFGRIEQTLSKAGEL